ncbi:hypothetical protein [Gaetbulibacter saemankumensis]|uniref:hypothetical protein n=1 Tax=Gaetbulibacter saemankumensis TaxID=311208 RepID=UPI0004155491|nr:hypothetical protein [Gaetbulibacter saemankumensis]
MSNPNLKIVSISNKNLKKELMVSSNEVTSLRNFLKEVIGEDILIINTNLGLDIYYLGVTSHEELIVSSFLLVTAGIKKERNNFYIKSLNSRTDVMLETQIFFRRLIKNPLLCKSYIKSLSNQLNEMPKTQSKLLKEMVCLWKEVFFKMNEDTGIDKMIPFLVRFQDNSYSENNNPVLQHLIKAALSADRIN